MDGNEAPAYQRESSVVVMEPREAIKQQFHVRVDSLVVYLLTPQAERVPAGSVANLILPTRTPPFSGLQHSQANAQHSHTKQWVVYWLFRCTVERRVLLRD